MLKQILFAASVLITLGVFAYTTWQYYLRFRLTQAFPVKDWGKRFNVMMTVAFGQSRILRKPVVGMMHALVWWGFLVILVGSIEMIIDGLFGTDRALGALGVVYDIITASGDVFALIILMPILAFMVRRIFMNIHRFTGIEMKHKSHQDANIALTLILLLMVSLLGMNTFYLASVGRGAEVMRGVFPVSRFIAGWFDGMDAETVHV